MPAGSNGEAAYTVHHQVCVGGVAELRDLQRRVRERNVRIRALLDEHEADEDAMSRLSVTVAEAAEESRTAAAAAILEAQQEGDARVAACEQRWSASVSDLEARLEHQRVHFEGQVATLQTNWRDAIATIRQLEATLDKQHTAALTVTSSAATLLLQQQEGGGGGAPASMSSTRVASVSHTAEHQHARWNGGPRSTGTSNSTSVESMPHAARAALHHHGSTSAGADADSRSAEGGNATGRSRQQHLEREAYAARAELLREREERHRLAAELESTRGEMRVQADRQHADAADARRVATQGPPSDAVPSPLAQTLPPGPPRPATPAENEDGTPPPRVCPPEPTARTSSGAAVLDDEAARDATPPRPSGLARRRQVPIDPPTPSDDDPRLGHGGAMAPSPDPSTVADDSRPGTAQHTPERDITKRRPLHAPRDIEARTVAPMPDAPTRGGGAAEAPPYVAQRQTAPRPAVSVTYVRETSMQLQDATARPTAPQPRGRLTLGLVLGLRRQTAGLLGIEVVRVRPDSPAAHADIRAHSLLVELGGCPLRSSDDVAAVLRDLKSSEEARVASGGAAGGVARLPFQVIDLDTASAGQSRVGFLRIALLDLAVGPFNHHREHYTAPLRDLAPVTEFDDDTDNSQQQPQQPHPQPQH
jgi:hypothetical protein